MIHPFREIVLGDVLIASFVGYALLTLAAYLLLRPVARRIGAFRMFVEAPIVEVCLYICLLALLIVVF